MEIAKYKDIVKNTSLVAFIPYEGYRHVHVEYIDEVRKYGIVFDYDDNKIYRCGFNDLKELYKKTYLCIDESRENKLV